MTGVKAEKASAATTLIRRRRCRRRRRRWTLDNNNDGNIRLTLAMLWIYWVDYSQRHNGSRDVKHGRGRKIIGPGQARAATSTTLARDSSKVSNLSTLKDLSRWSPHFQASSSMQVEQRLCSPVT